MARTASIAVAGYYPTPPHLVPLIAQHLHVVHTGARCLVADPCAGDGAAVMALTTTLSERHERTVFGIAANELERTRYKRLRDNLEQRAPKSSRHDAEATNADAFTLDAHGRIDLLYLNPPYDTDKVHGRLEERFLARFTTHLNRGGALVFIIPIHALGASAQTLASEYQDIRVLGFPPDDHEVYRQVVVIAQRRDCQITGNVVDKEVAALHETVARVKEHGVGALPAIGSPGELMDVRPSGTAPRGMWLNRGFDAKAIINAYVPLVGARKDTPHPLAIPPATELGLSKFHSATLPRPAHIASGIAAGIFDGVVLSPNDPNAGLPSILVKGEFTREYTPVEEKRGKDGALKKIVEVQRPVLDVHYLDLSSGSVGTFGASTESTGARTIEGASVGDMIAWYGSSLVRALYAHCEVLHDQNNSTHQIPIFPTKRPLFPAQEQAAMACVRLLGGDRALGSGRSALLLAEVGTGKSVMSLAVAKTVGAQKILIFCPPHLLDGWREQAGHALRDHEVHVLREPKDVDEFAALPRDSTTRIALLSREMAKLGHGYTSVRGRCPKCGSALSDNADYVSSRARCSAKLLVPKTDAAHRIVALVMAGGKDVQGTKLTNILGPRTAELFNKAKFGPADTTLLRAIAESRVAEVARSDGWWGHNTVAEDILYWLNDPAFVRGLYDKHVKQSVRRSYYGNPLAALIGIERNLLALDGADEVVRAEHDSHYRAEHLDSRPRAWDACREFAESRMAALSYAGIVERISTYIKPDKDFSISTCGEFLYQAVPEPRRYPLAKYISRRYPDFADFLIIDEIHEAGNAGSSQEIAAHRLQKMGWPTLCLTGSLMNGYASSLFPNFWNMSPEFREEFGHDEGTLFQRTYGYFKRTVDVSESTEYVRGSMSERKEAKGKSSQATAAPGVLPSFVIRHLLRYAVTLQKADLGLNIPQCTEVPTAVVADGPLQKSYDRLAQTLVQQIKDDAFTDRAGQLFGAVAELPSFLDRSAVDTGNERGGDFVITYPDGQEVTREPPVFDKKTLSAKERWMVETVQAELAAGRNVLVLTYHLNLMARVVRLIESGAGTKVVQLVAAKVPTYARQEWINENVVRPGVRVMVANPTTIQTGLNNLVHFATEIFLENPACNPLVYRQAIGRIDRIGQTRPTTVFFPYYTDTVQAAARKLLSDKVNISLATDGLDPEEALSAVGVGDGALTAALSIGRELYRALNNGD